MNEPTTANQRLAVHLNAMCGWAETLAEKQGWTRQNAASFWRAYDAARSAVNIRVECPQCDLAFLIDDEGHIEDVLPPK